MMSPEAKLEELKRATRSLGEFFDAVQILATGIGEDGCTESFRYGAGNMFSRIGLADDFVEYERACIHVKARQDMES